MYYSIDSYTPLRYSTISSSPRVCTLVLFHLICKRFFSFYKKALLGSYLVRSVYYKSSILCYTFTGYNVCAGEDHLFSYQPNDYIMSNIVRTFRCVYGSKSPFEDVIRDISCS